MPPHPWCYEGLTAIAPLLRHGLSEPGDWRLVPTRANAEITTFDARLFPAFGLPPTR
jgi:hypothetical protein